MTRTSCREPRHRIIHVFVASHDEIGDPFDWSGDIGWPVVPPESVDCILLTDFYCNYKLEEKIHEKFGFYWIITKENLFSSRVKSVLLEKA